jgi:GNAT superfamily N-acetyltransferase
MKCPVCRIVSCPHPLFGCRAECLICLQEHSDLVSATCGHVFCTGCVRQIDGEAPPNVEGMFQIFSLLRDRRITFEEAMVALGQLHDSKKHLPASISPEEEVEVQRMHSMLMEFGGYISFTMEEAVCAKILERLDGKSPKVYRAFLQALCRDLESETVELPDALPFRGIFTRLQETYMTIVVRVLRAWKAPDDESLRAPLRKSLREYRYLHPFFINIVEGKRCYLAQGDDDRAKVAEWLSMPYDNRDYMMSEISMTLLTFEKIDGARVLRIHHMFVAPECRRQGVATGMLEHLDDASWWCEVPPGLTALFRKAGCTFFRKGAVLAVAKGNSAHMQAKGYVRASRA